jgi:hypothetical protein
MDVPKSDAYGVWFTLPDPAATASLRRLYEVRRVLEQQFAALFPRIGWCTAGNSGFDVLRLRNNADDDDDDDEFDCNHDFGPDEKRGKRVFQIRLDNYPVPTPYSCTEHDGSPEQVLAKFAASNPVKPISSYNRSEKTRIPAVYARFKYGATARHATAFAYAVEQCGFVVLSTWGVVACLEDGNPWYLHRGWFHRYLSNDALKALRSQYEARDKIHDDATVQAALKRYREQPY